METALIDVQTGERTDTVEGSGGAFSPNGRSLVVNKAEGEDPDSLVLVDVSSGNRLPLKGAQTSRCAPPRLQPRQLHAHDIGQ